MKLINKIIIVLTLLVISGVSVFAENETPVVTERKKIEKQENTNENVEKVTPQKNVGIPEYQKSKVKPKSIINNNYTTPKMGVTIYSNKPVSSQQAKKHDCYKCRFPKKKRNYTNFGEVPNKK